MIADRLSRRRPGRLAVIAAALLATAGASAAAVAVWAADAPARPATAARGVLSATPKTLWDVIQSAKPGDRIQLAEGRYGPLALNRKIVAAPGILIEAGPGVRAVFDSVSLSDSEGIEFRGVEVELTRDNGVSVGGGSRLVFTNLDVHAASGVQFDGMMLRNTRDVTVRDSKFHNLGTGVGMLGGSGLKILRNSFSDIQVDAIRGQTSNSEIAGNRGTNFRPKPGDHPDFIQLWATDREGASKANLIRDNVYERGSGEVAQGIFLESNEDVTIRGNALLGTMYNGISLSATKGAVVEGNFIQGYSDMGSRIIVRGVSSDVVVRDNVAEEIVNFKERDQDNPRYKAEGNRTIRGAKIGDATAMQAWLAQRAAAPKTTATAAP